MQLYDLVGVCDGTQQLLHVNHSDSRWEGEGCQRDDMSLVQADEVRAVGNPISELWNFFAEYFSGTTRLKLVEHNLKLLRDEFQQG